MASFQLRMATTTRPTLVGPPGRGWVGRSFRQLKQPATFVRPAGRRSNVVDWRKRLSEPGNSRSDKTAAEQLVYVMR